MLRIALWLTMLLCPPGLGAVGLEFREVETSRAVLYVGQEFELTARLRNTGAEALSDIETAFIVPHGLELRDAEPRRLVPRLGVQEQVELQWPVRATRPGLYLTQLLAQSGPARTQRQVQLAVSWPPPELPSSAAEEVRVYSVGWRAAVLENAHLRLMFLRNSYGYGPLLVYARGRNGWELVAASQPLMLFVVPDRAGRGLPHFAFPQTLAPLRERHRPIGLVLLGRSRDMTGNLWECTWEFRLTPISHTVELTYAVSSQEEGELLAWRGPWFYVGEGWKSNSHTALLPGLELLTGREMAPFRVPHPYKITVPLMAVYLGRNSEQGAESAGLADSQGPPVRGQFSPAPSGFVVGLMWSPRQKWDGQNSLPLAYFAPFRGSAGTAHSVLGLFVPTVPEWVAENRAQAFDPYPVRAGQRLQLRAVFFALPGREVFAALRLYPDRFGLPRMPSLPRRYEEWLPLLPTPPRLLDRFSRVQRQAKAILSTVREDGSWPVTAERLAALTRYALWTGKENLWRVVGFGRRWLETSPRAQYCRTLRDITAAMEAYLDTYNWGEDPAAKEQARCWAQRGLALVYLWKSPQREVMPFGTLPALGLEEGRLHAVEGLHYASALLRLSDLDDTFAWRDLAEGIVRCALQQWQEHPEGTRGLPEAWDVLTERPRGELAAGEPLSEALQWLLDRPGVPETVVLRGPGGRVTLTSEAPVQTAEPTAGGWRFQLGPLEREEVVTLVGGLRGVKTITVNGSPWLAGGEKPKGWDWSSGVLLLRTPGRQRATVTVSEP
ncbi:MAG TPA: hypothetical protein EYP85_03080 [Armatimonadetes bacterium]|nr:hypothetical protein [Armatimonadota bacterium]